MKTSFFNIPICLLFSLSLLSCEKEDQVFPESSVNAKEESEIVGENKAPDVQVIYGVWSGGFGDDEPLSCRAVDGVCYVIVTGRNTGYPVANADVPAILIVDEDDYIVLPKKEVESRVDYGSYFEVTLRDV